MKMNAAMKQEIVSWAAKIVTQSEVYAEALDPHRKCAANRNKTAFAMDSINAQARKLYFNLTGQVAP